MTVPSAVLAPSGVHFRCDCVPELGPEHCHVCGDDKGRPVAWSEAHPMPKPLATHTVPAENSGCDLHAALRRSVEHALRQAKWEQARVMASDPEQQKGYQESVKARVSALQRILQADADRRAHAATGRDLLVEGRTAALEDLARQNSPQRWLAGDPQLTPEWIIGLIDGEEALSHD